MEIIFFKLYLSLGLFMGVLTTINILLTPGHKKTAPAVIRIILAMVIGPMKWTVKGVWFLVNPPTSVPEDLVYEKLDTHIGKTAKQIEKILRKDKASLGPTTVRTILIKLKGQGAVRITTELRRYIDQNGYTHSYGVNLYSRKDIDYKPKTRRKMLSVVDQFRPHKRRQLDKQ